MTLSSNEVYKMHGGIPKRLQGLIKKSGLSQNKYARHLGVFQQNISRYLHGQSPHAEFLIRLNRIDGINLCWFLTGSGKKNGV